MAGGLLRPLADNVQYINLQYSEIQLSISSQIARHSYGTIDVDQERLT